MASLRSTSRLLTRQISQLTSATSTANTARTQLLRSLAVLPITSQRCQQIHTSRALYREPDSKDMGSAGRFPVGDSKSAEPKHRVVPRDPESNDAYPDGAPGEPKEGESLPSGIPPSTLYNFNDIQSLSASLSSSSSSDNQHRMLIDVREPSELLEYGRIPGAQNIPIKTAADSFFMPAEDFEDKYGFARPSESDEVIFYCKAGVRSKAAARLAAQAGFGGKYGEFPGSFDEWVKSGGKVQRE